MSNRSIINPGTAPPVPPVQDPDDAPEPDPRFFDIDVSAFDFLPGEPERIAELAAAGRRHFSEIGQLVAARLAIDPRRATKDEARRIGEAVDRVIAAGEKHRARLGRDALELAVAGFLEAQAEWLAIVGRASCYED